MTRTCVEQFRKLSPNPLGHEAVISFCIPLSCLMIQLVMKTIELICSGCGTKFTRTERRQRQALRKNHSNFFCTTKCFNTHFPSSLHPCAKCSKPTSNPKFCSRKCAASINNRVSNFGSRSGRRAGSGKLRTCEVCNLEYRCSISHRSQVRCANCIRKVNPKAETIMTLQQFYDAPSVKGKHPSWRSALIRVLNRKWNNHLLKLPCARCGYSVHVELAHIKPISSFPPTSTLGEVNAESNNIQFCRNHHWEFDHHIFTLEDLPRIERGSFA